MTSQCEHTKATGERCRANARRGGRWCFFHDPAAAAARTEARRAGGRERSRRAAVLPADTPDIPLDSVTAVVGLLGTTINQVRRGELDSKQANAVGYLAGVLLRALQDSELAEQIEELRRQVEEVRQRGDGSTQAGGRETPAGASDGRGGEPGAGPHPAEPGGADGRDAGSVAGDVPPLDLGPDPSVLFPAGR